MERRASTASTVNSDSGNSNVQRTSSGRISADVAARAYRPQKPTSATPDQVRDFVSCANDQWQANQDLRRSSPRQSLSAAVGIRPGATLFEQYPVTRPPQFHWPGTRNDIVGDISVHTLHSCVHALRSNAAMKSAPSSAAAVKTRAGADRGGFADIDFVSPLFNARATSSSSFVSAAAAAKGWNPQQKHPNLVAGSSSSLQRLPANQRPTATGDASTTTTTTTTIHVHDKGSRTSSAARAATTAGTTRSRRGGSAAQQHTPHEQQEQEKQDQQRSAQKHMLQKKVHALLRALPDVVKKLQKQCPGPAAAVAGEIPGAATSLAAAAGRIAASELQRWADTALPLETEDEFAAPLKALITQVAEATDRMIGEAESQERWKEETAQQVREEVAPLTAELTQRVAKLRSETNRQLQLVKSRYHFSHQRHCELSSAAVKVQGMKEIIAELTSQRAEKEREITTLAQQVKQFEDVWGDDDDDDSHLLLLGAHSGSKKSAHHLVRVAHDKARVALQEARDDLASTTARHARSVEEEGELRAEIAERRKKLAESREFLEMETRRLETASAESLRTVGRHGRMTPRPSAVSLPQTQAAFRLAAAGFMPAAALARLRELTLKSGHHSSFSDSPLSASSSFASSSLRPSSPASPSARGGMVVPQPFHVLDLRKLEQVPEEELAVANGTASSTTATTATSSLSFSTTGAAGSAAKHNSSSNTKKNDHRPADSTSAVHPSASLTLLLSASAASDGAVDAAAASSTICIRKPEQTAAASVDSMVMDSRARNSLFAPWRRASTDNVIRMMCLTLAALQDIHSWQCAELHAARERSGPFLRTPATVVASSSSLNNSPAPGTHHHSSSGTGGLTQLAASGDFVSVCPALGNTGPTAIHFFAAAGARPLQDATALPIPALGSGAAAGGGGGAGSLSPERNRRNNHNNPGGRSTSSTSKSTAGILFPAGGASSPTKGGGGGPGGGGGGGGGGEDDATACALYVRPSLAISSISAAATNAAGVGAVPTLELPAPLLNNYLDMLCAAVDSFRVCNPGLFAAGSGTIRRDGTVGWNCTMGGSTSVVPVIVRYLAWSSNATRHTAIPISSTAADVHAAAEKLTSVLTKQQQQQQSRIQRDIAFSSSSPPSPGDRHLAGASASAAASKRSNTSSPLAGKLNFPISNNISPCDSKNVAPDISNAAASPAVAVEAPRPLVEEAAASASRLFGATLLDASSRELETRHQLLHHENDTEDDATAAASSIEAHLLPPVEAWPAWFIEVLPRALTRSRGAASLRFHPAIWCKQAALAGALPMGLLRQHADVVRRLRLLAETEAKECEAVVAGAANMPQRVFRSVATRLLRTVFIDSRLPLQALPAVAAWLPRKLALAPSEVTSPTMCGALFRLLHYVQTRLAAILLKKLSDSVLDIMPPAGGHHHHLHHHLRGGSAAAAAHLRSSAATGHETLQAVAATSSSQQFSSGQHFISAAKLRRALDAAGPVIVAALSTSGFLPVPRFSLGIDDDYTNTTTTTTSTSNNDASSALETMLPKLVRLALLHAQAAKTQRRGASANASIRAGGGGSGGTGVSCPPSPGPLRRGVSPEASLSGDTGGGGSFASFSFAASSSDMLGRRGVWVWNAEALGDKLIDGMQQMPGERLQGILREKMLRKASPKRGGDDGATSPRRSPSPPPEVKATAPAPAPAAAALADVPFSSSSRVRRSNNSNNNNQAEQQVPEPVDAGPRLPPAVLATSDWIDASFVFRRLAFDLLLADFVN